MTPAWTFAFEVDFATNPGDPPTSWTDLSGQVRNPVTVDLDGYCTVMLNNRDRALDPTNPASPYDLGPSRHARLLVTVDGQTRPLWRGLVEEWAPLWPEQGQAVVQMRGVDASAWLALQEDDLDLPWQSTGERIGTVLDAAGWPQGLRDVDPGRVRMEPVLLDSVNLWQAVAEAAAAEDGDLWIAPDGAVTFRDRHGRFDQTPDVEVGSHGADGLVVGSVEADFSAGEVVNIARFEFDDGRVAEWIDDDSVARYGPRVWPTRDLPLPTVEASARGAWQVYKHAEPRLTLPTVTVHGHRDPKSSLPKLLDLHRGVLVRYIQAPPGGGQVDELMCVESVSHRATSDAWTTTLQLVPNFGEGPWFRLEESALDSPAKLAP